MTVATHFCTIITVRTMKNVVAIIMLVLLGCNIIPEKVTMEDPRVKELLKAAYLFDRATYGFTPITSSADVRFEYSLNKSYDAMLHIHSETSRTIAFRKTADGYRWIGEQEIFTGPKQYTAVDGTFYENICITYDIEKISGFPTNRLNITYFGEDKRLTGKPSLNLADVRPILKDWHY